MNKKTSESINQAVDLLIDNNTDVSTILKEGGLLKELTKRLILDNQISFKQPTIYKLCKKLDYRVIDSLPSSIDYNRRQFAKGKYYPDQHISRMVTTS